MLLYMHLRAKGHFGAALLFVLYARKLSFSRPAPRGVILGGKLSFGDAKAGEMCGEVCGEVG